MSGSVSPVPTRIRQPHGWIPVAYHAEDELPGAANLAIGNDSWAASSDDGHGEAPSSVALALQQFIRMGPVT